MGRVDIIEDTNEARATVDSNVPERVDNENKRKIFEEKNEDNWPPPKQQSLENEKEDLDNSNHAYTPSKQQSEVKEVDDDRLLQQLRKEAFENKRREEENFKEHQRKWFDNHTPSNDKQDKADEEDTSELVMTEESWENLEAAKSEMITDKQNKCDDCGKEFITSNGMEKHMVAVKSKVEDGSGTFYLGGATLQFARHFGLVDIIEEGAENVISEAPGTADSRVETSGEKQNKCKVCEKKFRKSTTLRNHIRISNDKQDKADEEDTSKLVMTEESWENQEDTSEWFCVTEESW